MTPDQQTPVATPLTPSAPPVDVNDSASDETAIPVTIGTSASPSVVMPEVEAPTPQADVAAPVVSEPPVMPTESANVPPSSEVPAPQPVHNPKSHIPTGVIVFAVIVALGLGGLTVFTFLQNKKTAPTPKGITATAPTEQGTLVPADIDQTNADLEASLNEADNKDINDNDLSDTSLGL